MDCNAECVKTSVSATFLQQFKSCTAQLNKLQLHNGCALYIDDTSLIDATTPVSEVRITFMFISIYAWYLSTVQIQI